MANQGAAYIMGSDKTSVDDPMGSNQLNREGLEFTTETNPDVLTQDMPRLVVTPSCGPSVIKLLLKPLSKESGESFKR